MRSKPHTEITSISQTVVEKIVEDAGVPMNFVESAEATFRGLPDLNADPQARQTMERLKAALDEELKQRSKQVDGEPDPQPGT